MIHTLLVPRSFKKDKEMYILLNVLHCTGFHKCGHAKYSE